MLAHSKSKKTLVAVFVVFALISTLIWLKGSPFEASPSQPKYNLSKGTLSEVLQNSGNLKDLPTEVTLPIENVQTPVILQYAFDPKLQKTMDEYFQKYRPDYGAFVAIDPSTGRVLSLLSYSRDHRTTDNLALRATFPSASVFKVVTAAAAIAEKNFTAHTVIPFNGRNHTLYKSNVFKNTITRWTRHITLKDAFAQSINTVFARIGTQTLAPEVLRDYASRFGFNRVIASDIPVQPGRAVIPEDEWGIAEAASGYTRENTMSPLQGALIAATVANKGTMMEPYVVESVHTLDGALEYKAEPKPIGTPISETTAAEIQTLMHETVTHGTSKKSFRGFFKGPFADMNVGGKTGSLTGEDPPGKYDWFVGFADYGNKRIAIAALTVHQKLWRVKSSYLARVAIEDYFKSL